MKAFGFLLHVVAICILGACAYLVYDQFTNTTIFWLDFAVVLSIYIVNIGGIKGLFVSTGRFSKIVAGYGIGLVSQFTYTLLAIAGILIGYFKDVDPGWQIIYQASFLLYLGWGTYMAMLAIERQQGVKVVEEKNQQPLLKLREKTEMLKYKASSSAQLSSVHKQQINVLVERIGMFSPNSSSVATLIEDELSGNLDALTRLVSGAAINATSVEQVLATVESQVAERMKLVTT